MGKKDKPPENKPTPAPIAESVADEVAEDVIADTNERKFGRMESFLTRGQKPPQGVVPKKQSLLGQHSNKVG